MSRKREFETESGVWAWTLGDDSDSEDDGRINLMPKRRIRRQTPPPPAPVEGAPPPAPPASGVPVIDTASSSSESDGISSNTSGDEEEVEEVEGTASGSQPTGTSASIASTTTVSQSFTTLIPGSAGEAVSESSRSSSSSRSITSLTPVLTVENPETTYTSFEAWTTTLDEPSSVLSTVTSESSSASRAAQSSAAADADSSPTPQIIRVHHHPHNLSKDAIHGLIAFGALGGLMGVLAIAWFFWRRHRKQNQDPSIKSSSDGGFAPPSFGSRLLARIPFLKDRFASRGWFNLDQPYYKDNNNSRTSVFLEKSISVKSSSASRLDSQFFAPNQVMGVAVRVQGGDNPPAVSQNIGGLGHHPVGSISSLEPQRSNTVRNGQPPFPPNPLKRASEISSLSSGFGDGDLLMGNGQSTMERLPQPPPSARFAESVASRRDTVYTEASEDQPPRFRNVNSWVRQQTGRIKRSQARAQDDDAPPVPQMPSEENYAMMLPDGEEPRRA